MRVMVGTKMTFILLFTLLVGGHYVGAVVNKKPSQTAVNKDTDQKTNDAKADDRLGSSYGLPANEYGPPRYNGPAPVYGPPELIGVHGPTPTYPPLSPNLPSPVYGSPATSYGPPLGAKPHFGPPKPTYGPPKINFGPPPKQHFGPLSVSFLSFRGPKPQYGPPLKLTQSSLFSSTPSLSNHFGSGKPAHGPPIPISIETYGPPLPQTLSIPFKSEPKDEYGPPPPPLPAPQPQYGPPIGVGDHHQGPAPPVGLPGVPAPPTPPDIKYDGWQPIAGLTSQNHHESNEYVPPPQKYVEGTSPSGFYSASPTTNSNVPSDSYGKPIDNPEAQHLKTSVSSDGNGLPPPPLPSYDGLDSNGASRNPVPENGHRGNIDQHSGTKTIGFEFLSNNAATLSSLDHSIASLHADSGSSLSLPALSLNGLHDRPSGLQDASGLENLGDDITLQRLPGFSTNHFGKVNVLGEIPLPPPPPILDSYGAPPLSSYSPDGPYPAAQSGRGSSSHSSSFGLFDVSFHKHASHHHKSHGPLKSYGPPLASLIPPRNREPIKFRQPIPTGLLTNLHRYLPPLRPIDSPRPSKLHVPLLSLGPQLPNPSAPLAFHQSSSAIRNSFGSALSSSDGSFGKVNLPHVLNSPIAAPNVQYGTPLSFTDFNTPAPILTYGAPNFGPASSFSSTSFGIGSNLYDGIGSALTTTYGTPLVNPSSTNAAIGDCGLQHVGQHFGFENGGSQILPSSTGTEFLASNYVDSLSSSLSSSTGDQRDSLLDAAPALPLLSNVLSPHISPPINELDLQSYDQQKSDLKDSYGNPVGISYDTTERVVENEETRSGASVLDVGATNVSPLPTGDGSPHKSYSPPETLSFRQNGATAEALTASLTAQTYGEPKNLGSNEVDAGRYLKTSEGSEALALAQGPSAIGSDGFQIQGSKGTYMLQIQAADGGLGTENSDGSIRHEHILSNGLLQDILAAIEQPDEGRVQIEAQLPQAQPLEQVYGDVSRVANDALSSGRYIMIEGDGKEDIEQLVRQTSNRIERLPSAADAESASKNEAVALFYDNRYDDTRKETRSIAKDQESTTLSSVQSRSNEQSEPTKSS